MRRACHGEAAVPVAVLVTVVGCLVLSAPAFGAASTSWAVKDMAGSPVAVTVNVDVGAPVTAPVGAPVGAPVTAPVRPTVTVTAAPTVTVTAAPSAPALPTLTTDGVAHGVTAAPEVLRDLRYAATSPAQVLDLYLPRRTGRAVPLVVFVHGGAFSGGDKADLPAVDEVLRRGYAVASVNYRLSGEAPFPAAVQDVKAAIRWLRVGAGGHGVDPAKVAVWGASAGGYLADMVGVSGGVASALDDASLGNAGVSSGVQAVVAWYGPTDFTAMDRQTRDTPACAGADGGHDAPGSPEGRFLATAVTTRSALVAASDPVAWLPSQPAGSVPPFLLAHGAADCTVPPGQSRLLAEALRAAHVPVELTLVEGAGHAGDLDARLLAPTLDFVDRTLGRPPAGG